MRLQREAKHSSRTGPNAASRVWPLKTGLLFLCALLGACPQKPETGPVKIANTNDPQWVVQQNPPAKVALVFIHGIYGDTLDTWKNASGRTFFDYLKSNPDVGPKVDMFAFGYTTNMIKDGSFDIREAANKLQATLQYKKVLDYPAIVFVAHSMGGLVVLRNLLGNRDLIKKTKLVVLYATPQEGAQISAIANVVAKNPALVQMFPADANGFLQELNDDWKRLAKRPPVKCGYEKLPTYGVVIVPWSSATRFCDGAPSAIANADHITIVKPDRAEHDSVVLLVNALNEHVLGASVVARLETPDFQENGNDYVYDMLDPSGRNAARLVNSGGTALNYTLAQISDNQFHLWPDDTPRQIEPHQTERLHMALGYGALAREYRFVLKTDVTPDRTVIVRVPGVDNVRAKQAALMQSVSREINAYLADDNNAKELAALAPGSPLASEKIVSVAGNAVAKEVPDLPEAAKWVMSAEVLAASNWPDLATIALRRAEKLSPKITTMPATRHLASVIAKQSGKPRVFANAETPTNGAAAPRTNVLTNWITPGQSNDWFALASRLQGIPALKSNGLALEGDVWAAKGDQQAALQAYRGSAALHSTPSVAARIESLGVGSSATASPK